LICFDIDFYVNEAAIRAAIRRKSCFNLIHLPTSFKIDVSVIRPRPFDVAVMSQPRQTQSGLGMVQPRADTAQCAGRIAVEKPNREIEAEDSLCQLHREQRSTRSTAKKCAPRDTVRA